MKMTTGFIEKVMDIVSNTLGVMADDVKGLYADEEILDGMSPDESHIYVDVENQIEIDTCYTDCGMTKLVIFDRDFPYVIKLPFTGLFKSEYNEDMLDYEDPVIVCDTNTNIIDEEMAMIDNVPAKIAELLVPNVYVGLFGAIPVYIQKKICGEYPSCTSSSRSIEYVDERGDYEEEFVDSLINRFGIQGALDRIDTMDTYLEDLHKGNYGYDKFGNCWIYDYGGYDSSMWEWRH